MSASECARFEQKLAFFAAPSLLGIKCASLLSLRKAEFQLSKHIEIFNTRAQVKGLRLKVLCECKNRYLVLIYQEAALRRQLAKPTVQAILRRYGYAAEMTLESLLERLSGRIRQCVQFPHEIGLFLDYPTEDVQGFIENQGENYVLCGYWKVYGKAEKAKHTFASYDKCRKFLCNKLNQGYDIYQALKIS